jgi:GNAT superfamily N-acetyltransferase
MIGLMLAVAVAVEAGDAAGEVTDAAGEVTDAERYEAAKKAVKALADTVPAPVDAESVGEAGATMEFYWAPAEKPVEAPKPVTVETPVVPVAPVAEPVAPGFHSEVEIFRVAASARGKGEARKLLDATVAKLVAKGVDRSRIETDVSIGPRKVRIQIVKVKHVVRDPEGSTR